MHDLFRHEAMPYDGTTRFVPTAVSVVRDGLERDDRVIVLADGVKVDSVRDELGDDAEDVTFVATDDHGRNPCRITTILHSFQLAGDGRHSLGVNETVFVGRSRAAHSESQYADSVLNDPALRTWPMSVVCMYDTGSLDAPTVSTMYESHAVVRGRDHNADYRPSLAGETYATPLTSAPAYAARMSAGATMLAESRDFVRERCAVVGIAPSRADDLVLAVNEIVTNSLRYGGGTAALAVWFDEGSIVCEVADAGHLRDPLAGRFAPPPSAVSGRGLWLVNHLCDLVRVRSAPGRTVVRMYVERDTTAR